jgi:hypothetical protein
MLYAAGPATTRRYSVAKFLFCQPCQVQHTCPVHLLRPTRTLCSVATCKSALQTSLGMSQQPDTVTSGSRTRYLYAALTVTPVKLRQDTEVSWDYLNRPVTPPLCLLEILYKMLHAVCLDTTRSYSVEATDFRPCQLQCVQHII